MAAVPPLPAGLRCRCPRCGEEVLFSGLLDMREACGHRDFDLRAHDAGDGPAVLVILLLGALVVAAALVVEAKFSPPLWIHAVPWPIFILGGAIAMLRPSKATLVAPQFRHRDL
jgi:uncharacterized protein (DUF983 family)